MFSLRRWRPAHLVMSWLGYWAALAVIKLGPGLTAARIISDAPKDAGNATINAGSDGFSALVSLHGETIWSASTSIPGMALWLAGPPMLLWLIWLLQTGHSRRQQQKPAELSVPADMVSDEGRIPTPERVMRTPEQ